MATKYIVDTHALIWFLGGDSRLGANARAVLQDTQADLILPVIALAEACWIVEAGRTTISSVNALLKALDADPRIKIMPLDRAILDTTLPLAAIPEMHDRQIVATALYLQAQGHSVAILTKDGIIKMSYLVPVVW